MSAGPVIPAVPGVDALRTAVDAFVADAQWSDARQTLARLWAAHAGPSTAGFVLSRIERFPDPGKPVNVAILRSFTAEPLVPVLRAAAAVVALPLEVRVGGFNTYAQELLDERSELYSTAAPDIAILAVLTRDIAPSLWTGSPDLGSENAAAADEAIDTMESLIRSFRARSSADLIVHGLEEPPTLAMGLADRRATDGQRDAVRRANRDLASICDGHPGVHFLDFDAVVASCGRHALYDEAKWITMRMPLRTAFLARIAHEWLRFLQPLTGRTAKVLAVDLDNTVWGGVVGEDGVDALRIGGTGEGRHYLAVQEALIDLRARGVLIAVNSKNNEDDALAVFERHPAMALRREHISSFHANWDDKAQNLRQIAADLNVGLDAVAFLDDNPAERAVVATAVPEAIVLELGDDRATWADSLRVNPYFERLQLTLEDRERAEYYARQRTRNEAASNAGNVEDFLRSLKTHVSIDTPGAADFARVVELTQKTNQCNVTTRHVQQAELEAMLIDPRWRVYALRASDRFGDHGLVGVALVESNGQEWRVDTLLLSCRVIGRNIESALLEVISDDALAAGATALTAEFKATAKNSPSRDIFARHGFSSDDPTGDHVHWRRALAQGPIRAPDWVLIERGPMSRPSSG